MNIFKCSKTWDTYIVSSHDLCCHRFYDAIVDLPEIFSLFHEVFPFWFVFCCREWIYPFCVVYICFTERINAFPTECGADFLVHM